MFIKNTQVYGLKESIIRSGYPMSLDADTVETEGVEITEQDINRAKRLAQVKTGTGHDCFLKGIIVQADITAPQYWWLQFERYHFWDTISSMSTMHRIDHMDISKQCNQWVDERVIEVLKEKVEAYNEAVKACLPKEVRQLAFQEVISNVPEGLMLTKGIYTNYLQLKTIYFQRKGHKLKEWEIFNDWVICLPMFADLIFKYEE